MRVLLPCGLFLALLLASGACMGQTVIHHCIAADGTPVFTDQPCSSLGATPVAHGGNPLTPGTAHGPRHCPLDRKALKQRITRVFRHHDANALAGLMLWHGYGERGATHTVKQLAQLMQSPFLGFVEPGRSDPHQSSSMQTLPPLVPRTHATQPAPDMLTLRFANPLQPRVSFRIIRRDGCLWLEP